MSPVCVTAYVQGYVFTPSFGSKAKLIKNYKAEHPFIFSADPNNISLKITKKKQHIYRCRRSTLCVSDRFLLFLFFSLCVLCPMSLSLCLSCGFPCSLSACFSASLPPWQFAIHVHSLHPHSARFCEPPASFNLWPSPAISSHMYFLKKSKKYIFCLLALSPCLSFQFWLLILTECPHFYPARLQRTYWSIISLSLNEEVYNLWNL